VGIWVGSCIRSRICLYLGLKPDAFKKSFHSTGILGMTEKKRVFIKEY
jgi:hypothetical protein